MRRRGVEEIYCDGAKDLECEQGSDTLLLTWYDRVGLHGCQCHA